MYTRATHLFRVLMSLFVVIVYLFTMLGNTFQRASAQAIITKNDPSQVTAFEISPKLQSYSKEQTTLPAASNIEMVSIQSQPKPPSEYEAERLASIRPTSAAVILPNFPSFSWVFGNMAVSGAMIAGYFDRGAFPNMYTGPTNGGVMPLTDTSWPTWSDGYQTYPNNPLIASHLGVDGLAVRGSIDDYWISSGSTAPDPYITGAWTQHTWGTAIGDYMKSSQSAFDNDDGQEHWYHYTDSGDPLTCADMEGYAVEDLDSNYGRKLFYEARGYTVTDCYTRNTDNEVAGGFSLTDFQAEINAGHPVLLLLENIAVVGYGYDGSTIYIRDTWDNNPANTYTMTWGGSYAGYELLAAGVVHLQPPISQRIYIPQIYKTYFINLPPTDILLSSNIVIEGLPANTVVGTLSTVDPNIGDSFTYSLVSGTGDTGNAYFNILSNSLRTSIVFDYETQSSYSIRVRTTDQGGYYIDKVFTIYITPPMNVNPIDINLFDNTIAENAPINSDVGTLTSVDPNVTDTFTYSLVSGTGDSGNAYFNIFGNKLRSSAIFDYETQSSYSIRIRTTDQGGLYFEKVFSILIIDINESAVIVNGDFEAGPGGWTEYSSNGWELILHQDDTPVTAHGGVYLAWLGGDLSETSRLSQTFIVPSSASVLHYWYWSASEDACGYDYFRIKVNSTIIYTRNLCSTTDTGGWVQASISLGAYINTSITLMFEATTNASGNSNLFLDDVYLASTLATSTDERILEDIDLEALVSMKQH